MTSLVRLRKVPKIASSISRVERALHLLTAYMYERRLGILLHIAQIGDMQYYTKSSNTPTYMKHSPTQSTAYKAKVVGTST